MIRAKLRLLGKFKLEMLKLEKDTPVQFSDLFIPRLFDRAVEAIKVVAHWDFDLGYYKTPATAQSLSALVKACCSMVKSEFIKSENHEKERQADRFLHLWKEEIPVTIHKKALEDQSNLKRNKKVILPSQENIKRLNDYLKKECVICLQRLNDEKQEFDRGAWLHLQECTLICIQLFNRRRAGEIERLTLENYENKKGIADDVDKKLLEKFSKNIQEYARQFIRITLRGKLSRIVSLLLTPFMTACIECILYFRQAANVKAENKFIFAKPGDNYLGKEYIRACPLMEKFSTDCGASMPKTLRGTTLRKHVATYASLLNIEECQVDKLANFLGHNKDIHKNIYRMPVPISEITEVSKLLTLAVGDEIVDEEEEDSEEEEEEDEEVERANKIVQKRREKSEKSLENQKCKKAKRRKTIESNDHNEDDNNNEDETDSDEKDDNYSSDDNNELIQQIKNSGKNKRTRLSIEKIKRMRWSKEEKDAVIEYFGNLEKLKKLPTPEQCQKLIDINPILQKISATVVKVRISNQRVTKSFK
ncbi:uncharacterized protein LOC141536985 [Cotesia typhae]|uniref:uncharacterized protein LOC141536985 n=1 Tax=Cotesia typhae TaxID=2053667 RepID=UPI003D685321